MARIKKSKVVNGFSYHFSDDKLIGIVNNGDVCLLLSNSGETSELLEIFQWDDNQEIDEKLKKNQRPAGKL